MKVRMDFVTNSSSSSYICVAKVNMCDELKRFMKEEYGRNGLKLLEFYVKKGKDIKDEIIDEDRLEDDEDYIKALFYNWSTEGDSEGDDAWLYDHIPNEYKEEVYVEG